MNLKFEKSKDVVCKDNVFIELLYEGGDADTRHPESYIISGVSFEEKESQEVIQVAEQYIQLAKILQKYDADSPSDNYHLIEEEYGIEMANLYDNVPNDPQCDYQYKCYLDDIKIVAYDKEGVKYVAHVSRY